MRILSLLTIALALLLFADPARAQTLLLRGLPAGDISIDTADLERLGTTEITDAREISSASGKERIEVVYRGVELARLLEAKGIDKLDRHRLRAASVIVTARDGYRASFSWGELFNSPAGKRVFVIVAERGPAPNPKAGAFTVRALGDLRPGPRHVRDVAEIRVDLVR